MNKVKKCFQCGEDGSELYGYTICDSCRSKLGLFSDETIGKHISLYDKPIKKRSYEEEIKFRLDFIEKEYTKKRIKLLHILERLKDIKS